MLRRNRNRNKTKKSADDREANSDLAVTVKAISAGQLESTVQTAITVCALLIGISLTLMNGVSYQSVIDYDEHNPIKEGLDIYVKG